MGHFSNLRCGCGRFLEEHDIEVIQEVQMNSTIPLGPAEPERWQVKTHTRAVPTTAFGTVEFQGGPHPTKARKVGLYPQSLCSIHGYEELGLKDFELQMVQSPNVEKGGVWRLYCIVRISPKSQPFLCLLLQYVRINYETPPETVVELLLREWRLRVPSLVISVLGGLANAPLQAKLASVVKRGILRAAKTTGAWVITNGLDAGVTRHVGEALGEEVHVRGSKIVALGIAPWGVVQQRNMLTGADRVCQYHAQGTLAGRQETALNPHHNYFLLADNGTSGKFSTAEICLRRRLEQYLAQQPIGLSRLGKFLLLSER
ncbi:unnamed protein product [Rodentolepis nana]|uniref:TRPM SLOG domain-containing protein n=1 Tax=Rodentolepis nana TaxID=102285 RepID=A0A3P7SH49_RODNA|nr:unnamed protein product [Rodentolepis nana]